MAKLDSLTSYLEKHFAKNYLGSRDLAKISYLKTGGIAKHCIVLRDAASLEAFEKRIFNQVPYIVLGRCSNVLISDRGFDEVVVFVDSKLPEDAFPLPAEKSKTRLTFPSGMALSRAVHFAHQNFLGGIEFFMGIPGSIGGAVFMNAGAEGSSTASHLKQALLFRKGVFRWVPTDQLELSYRHSNIAKGEIILAAAFDLQPLSKQGVREKRAQCLKNLNLRKSKQPLGHPSLGSTFKNPPGHFAAKLIEQAGLSGCSQGGISISKKHANFLYNDGSGTSQQALELIVKVEQTVQKTFSVKLEREIILLGEFS